MKRLATRHELRPGYFNRFRVNGPSMSRNLHTSPCGYLGLCAHSTVDTPGLALLRTLGGQGDGGDGGRVQEGDGGSVGVGGEQRAGGEVHTGGRGRRLEIRERVRESAKFHRDSMEW